MQVLNLTKGFEPYGPSTFHDVSTPFPSGIEQNIKLEWTEVGSPTVITMRLAAGESDLMRLFLAADALRRTGQTKIEVFIPYLPYARQDRVCSTGEAFSLKVLANLLNLQKFSKVRSFDVHSGAAELLIKRFESVPNYELVRRATLGFTNRVLVAPDAGAAKKIDGLASYLAATDVRVVQGLKVRAGETVLAKVFTELTPEQMRTCWIVDDICDGGATFISLASELRRLGARQVNLIVSHGLFTRGAKHLLENGIDGIWTTDSTVGDRTGVNVIGLKGVI